MKTNIGIQEKYLSIHHKLINSVEDNQHDFGSSILSPQKKCLIGVETIIVHQKENHAHY